MAASSFSDRTVAIEAVCRGTPHEMGVAQGRALRAKILDARNALARIESFANRRPRWMPYWMYRLVAEQKAWHAFAKPLADDYPETTSRIAGIAEGAGVGLKPIALFNVLEPMLSSVGGCTASPGACSAVAVRGSRSATGEPIVARNFDYLPLVQPYYVIRESVPTDGFRSLDFTTAPLAGAVDGMNEHGLCIAYDYAFTTDLPAAPAAPISMVISEALARCRTVSEAAAWITSRKRWGGGLLLLADATGDIASMEVSSTRTHLRRPAGGEDVLFHTNAFSAELMRQVQIPDDAVYDERAPGPLRGRRLHNSSDKRDARFRELINEIDVFDADRLASLMADHGPTDEPADDTVCVHGSYWFTTACLQFLPKSRQLRVAYDTACQAKYETLQL